MIIQRIKDKKTVKARKAFISSVIGNRMQRISALETPEERKLATTQLLKRMYKHGAANSNRQLTLYADLHGKRKTLGLIFGASMQGSTENRRLATMKRNEPVVDHIDDIKTQLAKYIDCQTAEIKYRTKTKQPFLAH